MFLKGACGLVFKFVPAMLSIFLILGVAPLVAVEPPTILPVGFVRERFGLSVQSLGLRA